MTGFFAVVYNQEHRDKDCIDKLVDGTVYHSHLSPKIGGLVTRRRNNTFWIEREVISDKPFSSAFSERALKRLSGSMGIGVVSDHDKQPVLGKFGDETCAFVTCGMVTNLDDLAAGIDGDGFRLSDENDDDSVNMAEVVAALVNQEKTVVEGIERMYRNVEGSCSLLMLNDDGLIAARDYHGRTPVFVGQGERGWAVTFESFAFQNLGFKAVKSLEPGEIVLVDKEGPKTLRQGDADLLRLCSFLPIYTGYPPGYYEGQSVHDVKQRCGALLAEDDAGLKIDIVAGTPDSGIGHAFGYCNQRNKMALRELQREDISYMLDFIVKNQSLFREEDALTRQVLEQVMQEKGCWEELEGIMQDLLPPEYQEAWSKYRPAFGRSYTPPDQETRERIAWNKLVAIGAVLAYGWDELTQEFTEGKRALVVDDSVVRGTQLRNAIEKLRTHGAKEIHVRIACPPLSNRCQYIRSTRTRDELAATRAIRQIEGGDPDDISEYLDHRTEKYAMMVDVLKEEMGVDSLKYIPLEKMVQAIGLPREHLCVDCWR
jgi:amidophosphoribosyltransferase